MVDIVSLAEKSICVCVKCKSVLSFSPKDVTAFVERKYIGQANKRYSLICPVCDYKLVSTLSWFPVGHYE